MPFFQPKTHQKYVGNLSSYTEMNVEYDEDLYFDEEEQQFFIVSSTESAIPPNVSPNYTTKDVSKQFITDLLSEKPEIAEKAQEFLD